MRVRRCGNRKTEILADQAFAEQHSIRRTAPETEVERGGQALANRALQYRTQSGEESPSSDDTCFLEDRHGGQASPNQVLQ